jgi:hypothetical protein
MEDEEVGAKGRVDWKLRWEKVEVGRRRKKVEKKAGKRRREEEKKRRGGGGWR